MHESFSSSEADNSLLVVFPELANPDIAEANGVAMILELDRPARRERPDVGSDFLVPYFTNEFFFVVQHNAIENHRDIGFLDEFAGIIPERRFKDDVVALPFTRFLRG